MLALALWEISSRKSTLSSGEPYGRAGSFASFDEYEAPAVGASLTAELCSGLSPFALDLAAVSSFAVLGPAGR